jgi:hypothetical protein
MAVGFSGVSELRKIYPTAWLEIFIHFHSIETAMSVVGE